jgi:4-hydroxy-3-methylbut-2-enyl diphosphate reductase
VPIVSAEGGARDPVITATSLTKRYGELVAVDGLELSLERGTVTGFLGPNGAGKTTTLRMLLGLAEPTAGEALVFGRRYRELEQPARRVGAVLESNDFHPGRSGRDHLRTLALAAEVLGEWSEAVGPRRVVLANPRASCAGVERAIEVVERALERYGAPLYVRRQIVHNTHVVRDLERRGAVFVDEVDDVPEGGRVVFSAHGVSPAVRGAARERGLEVIDATCPLVSKVHAEARRFSRAGYTILLVGHAGHDEIEGTLGEAPESIRLVEHIHEAREVEADDPDRVAYLTQTTLAVDETSEIVDTLRERFPGLTGPRTDDICYATQNRQDAVRALAADCDAVLVVGSSNSSNSMRLVEVAERAGCPAHLVDGIGDVDPAWLRGVRAIGVTAGASAPERVVQDLVASLEALGPLEVTESDGISENVRFGLPAELKG